MSLRGLWSRIFSSRSAEDLPECSGEAFRMVIDELIAVDINNQGTIATGVVASGRVALGDKLDVVSSEGDTLRVDVGGIEVFQKDARSAQKDDQVGILLSGVKKQALNRGDILQTPR